MQTERIQLRLAENEEMQRLIDAQTDAELKQAYREMLEGCIAHPEQRMWYGVWMMELTDGTYIGDLCFKGLSADGTVEIGYGLLPEYWNRGYATEAVRAMTLWAAKQPGVRRIEAETEPANSASQRVLEKAGYCKTGQIGEEGPRFVWNGSF